MREPAPTRAKTVLARRTRFGAAPKAVENPSAVIRAVGYRDSRPLRRRLKWDASSVFLPAIRRMKMLGLLILLAAQGVVAEDQAQFDKAWAQVPPTQAEWSFSRDAAFDLYEWTQAQFTLGYCSEFLPVADAGRMRAFPNEQDLMQTRLGQGLITTGHANFDKGVAYRDKDKPDEITCIQAMAGRGEKLKAITAPRNGSITKP